MLDAAFVVVRSLLEAWPAARPRRSARGFTLIEIMLVVVIIAVLAVLAVPTITGQMRSRRTQFMAREVASLYRNARMRAMGRGSAVLVRYDSTVVPEGHFQVREAVRAGADPDCQRLPLSNCTMSSWVAANNDNMLVRELRVTELADAKTTMRVAKSYVGQLDVCFSPLGRTFVRTAQIGPFATLTDVPEVRIKRMEGGNPVGPIRLVLVLPNGNARLGEASTTEPP